MPFRTKNLALIAALSLTGSAFALSVGQKDDFQAGTDLLWTGGTAPVNVPNGGPLGAGDKFLRASSNGAAGPGGHMAFYNQQQWAGGYPAAGIRLIECDMNNLGATALNMRLIFFSSTFSRYASNVSVDLPANSGWRHVYFPLRASDLVSVQGTDSYAVAMSDVIQLMFRHNPTPSANGVSIAATLGVDNITASAGWKVAGHIAFNDLDPSAALPATATLEYRTHNTTTVVYRCTAIVGSGGAYSAYSPPVPGAYDISLKVGHWLRRTVAIASTNSDLSLDFSLINGDVDDDNEVAIGDYAQLSSAFNSSPGDGNWNPNADLNGDVTVDIGDYAVLSGNFGLTGDD
jgi:hypothetical protein